MPLFPGFASGRPLLALFLVWASLVGAPVCQASEPSCPARVVQGLDEKKPGDLFKNLETENPTLYRALNSSGTERWRRSPDPALETVRQSIVGCKTGTLCKIEIYGKKFKFDGAVRRGADGSITVDIYEFVLTRPNPITGIPELLAVGSRPKNLNLAFSNMFGAVLAGVGQVVRSDPQVRKVRVVGASVYSTEIAGILTRFGFRDSATGLLAPVSLAPGDSKMTSASARKWTAKAAQAAPLAGYMPYNGMGKNWVLDLEVDRE